MLTNLRTTSKSANMIVDLKSITEEGESFNFDRESEEFQGVLDDIVGSNDYSVDVSILPLGNAFQVSGKVASSYSDTCSRCGYDVGLPIDTKIDELLVVEKARPRHAQSVRGQNSVKFDQTGPSVTYLQSSEFNLSEFVHEIVAFTMAPYPQCADRAVCDSQKHSLPPTRDIEEVKEKGHPAFNVLKGFKLKN